MSEHCKLINGPFSLLVQVVLGLIAMSSLLIKRKWFEQPQRPLKIWIYDVSKQIIGQLFAHACNIFVALIIVNLRSIDSQDDDECEWYLLNYLMDTIFGVIICYCLLRLQNWISRKYEIPSLISGIYHNIKTYFIQLALWLVIILISKIIILFCVIMPLEKYFKIVGDFMIRPLINHPKTELIIIMVIVPLIMNICQYLIQDKFLKNDVTNIPQNTEYRNYSISLDLNDNNHEYRYVNIQEEYNINSYEQNLFEQFRNVNSIN